MTITESMADSFITSDNPKKNKEINLKIAKACLQQKSFHLACKKFTQIGDRLSAMKSLLCSGDTEKIIFFASMYLCNFFFSFLFYKYSYLINK